MKNFFEEIDFDSHDLVAIVVLLGGFVLMILGKDGIVGAMMTAVVAFYFSGKAVKRDIPKVIDKTVDEYLDKRGLVKKVTKKSKTK